MTPFEKFCGRKPKITEVRVFGCLVFVIKPNSAALNRLSSLTQPCFFLVIKQIGASAFTVTAYNPATKRLIHPHFTDVRFDEENSYQSYKKQLLDSLSLDANVAESSEDESDSYSSDSDEVTENISTDEKVLTEENNSDHQKFINSEKEFLNSEKVKASYVDAILTPKPMTNKEKQIKSKLTSIEKETS